MTPVEVITISANRWNENCYILVDHEGQSCVVIDPGYDEGAISSEIQGRSLKVDAILATHAHFDHIASASALQEKFAAPRLFLHQEELKTLKEINIYTLFLNADRIRTPDNLAFIQEGDSIPFGRRAIRVLHTPGHTPGGCMFVLEQRLFSGDVLLKTQEELKRLPGHNPEFLKRSMNRIFEEFPETTEVFPGHGRRTTLNALYTFLSNEHLL